MAKLNKINLNGVIYDIEDSNAQSLITTLTDDLSQEISNRESAVNGVDGKVDAEVERAKKAEKANTDAIEAEVGARQSADEALQSAINDKADASALNDYALKSELSEKQDKLIAGTNIEITEDNHINVTIDTTLYVVVATLPASPAEGNENKIHLVPSESGATGDAYKEYIWKGDVWEKLGELATEVDLTDYAKSADVYTKTDVDTKLAEKVDQADYESAQMATANSLAKLATDKANAADVYTKTEVDSLVGNKVTAEVDGEILKLTIQ